MRNELKAKWAKKANAFFQGRKIMAIRYLTDEEQETLGWHQSAPVIVLDNGHIIYPSSDSEGNSAGSLFVDNHPFVDTLPSI